jgi:Peptidase M15
LRMHRAFVCTLSGSVQTITNKDEHTEPKIANDDCVLSDQRLTTRKRGGVGTRANTEAGSCWLTAFRGLIVTVPGAPPSRKAPMPRSTLDRPATNLCSCRAKRDAAHLPGRIRKSVFLLPLKRSYRRKPYAQVFHDLIGKNGTNRSRVPASRVLEVEFASLPGHEVLAIWRIQMMPPEVLDSSVNSAWATNYFVTPILGTKPVLRNCRRSGSLIGMTTEYRKGSGHKHRSAHLCVVVRRSLSAVGREFACHVRFRVPTMREYLSAVASAVLLALVGIPTFANAHSRLHLDHTARHHLRSTAHYDHRRAMAHYLPASPDGAPRRHAVSAAQFHEAYGRVSISRSCLTPETRQLLESVESRFGPVQIVSTCRPGAVIAGTRHASMHRYGRAVDFNAPSGRKAEIVRWLAANNPGGTMTYASMSHIHMDTGSYHFVTLGAGGRGRAHAHGLAPTRLARHGHWSGL